VWRGAGRSMPIGVSTTPRHCHLSSLVIFTS
jgi:hypothetical protein